MGSKRSHHPDAGGERGRKAERQHEVAPGSVAIPPPHVEGAQVEAGPGYQRLLRTAGAAQDQNLGIGLLSAEGLRDGESWKQVSPGSAPRYQ